MTYREEITEILEKKLIDKSDIFDYSGTPLEILCDKIFFYYKKLIEINSDLYKIDPNFFFFKNDTTINATAYLRGENKLTSINIGTIHKLKSTLLDNEKIVNEVFGESIQKINQLLIDKGSSVMEFMYYSAIIFLINHEIGHLIQNNDEFNNQINESLDENKDFKIENHFFEVDSDIFASMKLTQDIHLVWDKFEENYKTDELLCDLISLSSSAIGIFKLFNFTAKKGIYYKEKSHPHTAVRFIIIQEIIVDYISHIRKSAITDELKNKMMLNSFALIETLNIFHNDSFFDDFTKIINQNSDKIQEYASYLINEVASNKKCAYFKMKELEK